MKSWPFFASEPSSRSQGLSAGTHTPRLPEFAHSFAPGPGCGCMLGFIKPSPRACRRNHQVPRVPLPDVGVTSIRETCTVSSEDITPRSSLLQTHSSIPCGSPLLRPFGLVREVFAGCYQPLLLPGFSRRYLCESFLRCLVPYPGRSHRVHLPVSSSVSSAFPA